MKCLSLWQPWAWAIFEGKNLENRRWATGYRGPLLIHAAATHRGMQAGMAALEAMHFEGTLRRMPGPDDLHFGRILGLVELDAIHPAEHYARNPWADREADAQCWLLRHPLRLLRPIPLAGAQGVFDVADLLIPPWDSGNRQTWEPGVRACRECGCTDELPCDYGCGWVETDLCSACK